jgi:hypothetical protein
MEPSQLNRSTIYAIRLLFSNFSSHPEVGVIGLALIAITSYICFRRVQKGARVTRYLIGFIICTVFGIITVSKLYTMYQITGWVGGASIVTYQVRQKWNEFSWNSTTEEMEHIYWVSWTDQDIREPGPHRTTLLPEKWATLNLGDPIEITYVPRDPKPYVRNDIFDSNDNFRFDYMLLLAEFSAAVCFMVKMIRTRGNGKHRQDSEIVRLFD